MSEKKHELKFEISLPKIDTVINPNVFLPYGTYSGITKGLEKATEPVTEDTVYGKSISESFPYLPVKEQFMGALNDPNKNFKQLYEVKGTPLIPAIREFEYGSTLKGIEAIVALSTQLGSGNAFQVPLYHSGFWMTFMPPGDEEIVQINKLIAADKIQTGRASIGLAYSNGTIYQADRLVNFALSHVFETSIKTSAGSKLSVVALRKLIAPQDLNIVLWGFFTTWNISGFNYARACINDPDKCRNIFEERLNLTKLLWTSLDSLSEWQISHMSKRTPGSMEEESVKRYKSELACLSNKHIVLKSSNKSEIKMELGISSIEDWISDGKKYIDKLAATVTNLLTNVEDENDRTDLMSKQANSGAMLTYSQWVKSIELAKGKVAPEAMEQTLQFLSADDGVRKQFFDEILKFIDETTIAVIAIPEFVCPKCEMVQESDKVLPRLTGLIPIDTINVFIELIQQWLIRLQERDL